MVEITWLGHGTFQFRLESGEVIVMDPWVDGNPVYPKGHKFDRVDAILISHAHFDHIHDAVPLAKKFKPKVVAIYETCVWLTSKGVENCSGMNKGGTQEVGPLKVTMTHADAQLRHPGWRPDHLRRRGGRLRAAPRRRPRRFTLRATRTSFPICSSSRSCTSPELAFLPIGDFYTMGPREAALACRLLKAKKVVPMHFGTFPALTGTPDALAELLKDFPGPKSGRWRSGRR